MQAIRPIRGPMNFWPLIAIPVGGVALAFAAGFAAQRALRWARDDHSNRPALWNRFY